MTTTSKPSPDASWLYYAILSGACAALNGALAKLTTTELTTTWSTSISSVLHLESSAQKVFEIIFRAMFFVLNLTFNGIMWGLFTKALTLATSTVRVSVINTSANFFITALLGLVIFGEDLPMQWWFGASLLIAGSVIIGQREEGKGQEDEQSATVGSRSSLSGRTTAREHVDSPSMRTRSKAKIES